MHGIEGRRVSPLFQEDKRFYAGKVVRTELNSRKVLFVLTIIYDPWLSEAGREPLSGLMRRLLTGYVIGFNRRHGRSGQLFQNRYKSIVCQEETYLRELVRSLSIRLFHSPMNTMSEGIN